MHASAQCLAPRVALLVSLAFSALGCGSGGGGSGPPEAACVAVESRSLAWSEQSPLGFSADGLLRALGSERETRLTRADGTSTGLHLGLSRVSAGSVQLQTRERESSVPGQADAGTACGDVMRVPATLSFTTNDGAFDETWPIELVAEDTARAAGRAEFDLLAVAGDYSVTEVDPASFDQVVGAIALEFVGTAWAGELSGEARANGAGGAEHFDIGTFR